ncbi:MAG: hypothetical protein WC782_10140 [Methylococcaceae bacterium]|jgi:hypothetical protein
MSATIRIIVKSDKDDALVAESKLQQKGYQTTLSETSNVVLDGTNLGGHLDILSDPDNVVFIVIGTKQ